jgi:hypothetical protein
VVVFVERSANELVIADMSRMKGLCVAYVGTRLQTGFFFFYNDARLSSTHIGRMRFFSSSLLSFDLLRLRNDSADDGGKRESKKKTRERK